MNACINKPMILMCGKWRGGGSSRLSHLWSEMRSGVYSAIMLPVSSDAYLRGKTFPMRCAGQACHLMPQEFHLIQQTSRIGWSKQVVTWISICTPRSLRIERIVSRTGTGAANHVANGNWIKKFLPNEKKSSKET